MFRVIYSGRDRQMGLRRRTFNPPGWVRRGDCACGIDSRGGPKDKEARLNVDLPRYLVKMSVRSREPGSHIVDDIKRHRGVHSWSAAQFIFPDDRNLGSHRRPRICEQLPDFDRPTTAELLAGRVQLAELLKKIAGGGGLCDERCAAQQSAEDNR